VRWRQPKNCERSEAEISIVLPAVRMFKMMRRSLTSYLWPGLPIAIAPDRLGATFSRQVMWPSGNRDKIRDALRGDVP